MKEMQMILRGKRCAAALMSLAMLLTVLFGVLAAPASAKDYSTVRVKLSNANDGTLNLALNGRYTLEQNGASLPAEIVINRTANGLSIVNKATSAPIYSGSRARIVRAANQDDKSGLINMFTKIHGKNDYLGDMDIKASDSGFQVVNILPMEHYLYGVVAHEMNDSWPIEALKAQAVAARSYAAGYSGRYSDYDIVDNTNDQVYKGYKASNKNVIAAVDATRGQIAMYNGKIARCYYAASNGGQTELTTNVWSESIPYCTMKDDPYDVRNPQSPKQTIFFPKTVSANTPIKPALESFLKVQVAPKLKEKGYSTYGDQIKIVGIDSLTGGKAKYAAPSRNYKTAVAVVRVLGVKGSGNGISTSGVKVGTKPTKPEFTQVGENPNGPIYRDAAGNIYDSASVQLILQQYEARLREWESGETTLSDSGSGLSGQTGTVSVEVEFSIYDLKDKTKPYRLFTNDSLIMYYPEECEGGFNLVNVRFGHGVGMSQRGAQQMASEGKTYQDILNFYYEGISLSSSDYAIPDAPSSNATPTPSTTDSTAVDPNTLTADDEVPSEEAEVNEEAEAIEALPPEGIDTPEVKSALVSGWINSTSAKLYSSPDKASKSLGSVKRSMTVNVIQQQDDWFLVNMSGTGTIGYLPVADVVVSKGVGRVIPETIKMRKASADTPNITLNGGDLVSIVGRTNSYYAIALAGGGKGYLPIGDVEIVVKNPRATLPTNYHSGMTASKLTIYSDRAMKKSKKTVIPSSALVKVNAKTSNGKAYNVTYQGVTGYVQKSGVKLLKKGGVHPLSSKLLADYLDSTRSNALVATVVAPEPPVHANEGAPLDLNARSLQEAVSEALKASAANAFATNPTLADEIVAERIDDEWGLSEELSAATTELPGTIRGTTVNMRKEANTTSAIIRQLAGGENVTVLGKNGTFYYIRDSRGNVGYVSGDFVSVSGNVSVGVIRFEDVNVRQNPNTTSDIVANLSKGASVTVIGSSGPFYKVRTSNGKEGYIHEDLISVQAAEVPTVSGAGSGTTQTGKATSAGASSGRKPVATGVITGGTVNMRQEPNTTSAVLTTIPDGTRVNIIAKKNGFMRVSYNGKEGYVHRDYIPDSTWRKIGATSTGSGTTTTQSANSSNSGGKVAVANTGVNLRAEASSKSKRLAVVYKNEPVTVLQDMGEWLKVSAKGYTGYVLSKSIDR